MKGKSCCFVVNGSYFFIKVRLAGNGEYPGTIDFSCEISYHVLKLHTVRIKNSTKVSYIFEKEAIANDEVVWVGVL